MKLIHNPVKHALSSGQAFSGVWASFPAACTVEALAYSTYEWMLIDCEHSAIDDGLLHQQLQAAYGSPCTPVVRLGSPDPAGLKRALDLGVQNFMFPMIESAEVAAEIVAMTRYAPHGKRGIAGATRATKYGRIDNYLATAHQEISVIVQIETPAGLANVKDIASVDGVDCAFIGPNDLAAAMGYPGELQHPRVQEAIANAAQQILQAGKAVGILAATLEDAQRYARMGIRMVACGSDVRLMTRAADAMGTALREAIQIAP